MNFETFLKFSKIQYQQFLMVIFARDLVYVHLKLQLMSAGQHSLCELC